MEKALQMENCDSRAGGTRPASVRVLLGSARVGLADAVPSDAVRVLFGGFESANAPTTYVDPPRF
jgi:hypothetical protein